MRNIEVNLKNEFATVLLQNKPGYLLKTQMLTVSESQFVIQKVQPALLGIMGGSESALASIFAVAYQ